MEGKGLLGLADGLDRKARTCRAVLETPQGQRCKFGYDPDTGLFELAGVLPAGLAFPLAFGFVPGTRGGDGDPLDILILADDALPVGCALTARLLGVIEAEQTEDGKTCRNDRLVARLDESRTYADVDELDQLGPSFVEELAGFFVAYNDLKGKRFRHLATSDAARACALIEAGRLGR